MHFVFHVKSTGMYHQHFGLQEPPFSIAVNPRYLFMSPRHRDALAHLLYGVSSGGGFILLTGEVGTGKTTLNRCLLEQLPESTDIAIILNPALSATELLATACDELGIAYPGDSSSLKQLTDALHRFLLGNHKAGRRTVLMIDEAQHLDFDVLEQIRLLTNLETHDQKLLQIILIGQPELVEKLARPELRQLNQRITARYHLEPLNADETAAYVSHRLEVAGLRPGLRLFPPRVLRDIHRRTRGIPRLINVLCDRALLGAYGRRAMRVDRQLIREAAAEVLGGQRKGGLSGWYQWGLATLLLAVGTLGLLYAVGLTSPGGAQSTTTGSASVLANKIPPWLLPLPEAEQLLWHLASDDPLPAPVCPSDPSRVVQCSERELSTWEPVVALGRPVLLFMRRPDRFTAATIVLSVRGDRADVVVAGKVQIVPLAELAPFWDGGARYYWRVPEGWAGTLSAGDEGPVVAGVASLFAQLDQRATALSEGVFNAALKERVRLFQRSEGLRDDGVIGEQTLLRLNSRTGQALDSARAYKRLSVLSRSP